MQYLSKITQLVTFACVVGHLSLLLLITN